MLSLSCDVHNPLYRPAWEARYGFSEFVCSLNEPDEGVAPTDCRLRPDIRVMERQDFDRANAEKVNKIACCIWLLRKRLL